MLRALLTFAAGIGVGSIDMNAAYERVTTISERSIVGRLDGKKSKETVVEVTLESGQVGVRHRHPGPRFGYVLSGEYEWGVDGQPARLVTQGG